MVLQANYGQVLPFSLSLNLVDVRLVGLLEQGLAWSKVCNITNTERMKMIQPYKITIQHTFVPKGGSV